MAIYEVSSRKHPVKESAHDYHGLTLDDQVEIAFQFLSGMHIIQRTPCGHFQYLQGSLFLHKLFVAQPFFCYGLYFGYY